MRQGEDEFAEQVISAILAISPIGIHQSWTKAIYEDMQKLVYAPDPEHPNKPWTYRPLISHGSALRVWRLNRHFNWIDFVQQRVMNGRLPWPN